MTSEELIMLSRAVLSVEAELILQRLIADGTIQAAWNFVQRYKR